MEVGNPCGFTLQQGTVRAEEFSGISLSTDCGSEPSTAVICEFSSVKSTIPTPQWVVQQAQLSQHP